MDTDKLKKRKQRAKKDGNLRQLAKIVKDLGDLYFESGQMEEALQEYTEQLNVCGALKDKLNLAVAHRMIGEIHTNLANYEDALFHLNQYLDEAKQIDNLVEQQRAFATLGRTHFCLGEALGESEKRVEALTAAKKAYTKSLKLCQKLEATDVKPIEIMIMRARLLLNLGLVLEAQKESLHAVELIERAAELCDKHKLNQDLHRIHVALGALHERQEKYDEALKHYQRAAKITDDPLNITNARISEAELLVKLGRWAEARKILVDLYVNDNVPSLSSTISKLLKIVATIDRSERDLDTEEDNAKRMKLYEILGDAAVGGSSYEKAIEYYQGMLACAEKQPDIFAEKIDAALVSIAQTLKDAKRFDEALTFARRELKFCVNDDRETCRSALFLADLLTSINDSSDSEIRDIYQLALSSATRCGDFHLQRTVFNEMKEYFTDIGEFADADEIKEKIGALEPKIADDESSSQSSESLEIDIDLEDLSDVEREQQKKDAKNKSTRSRRQFKPGVIVKRNQKGETELHVACIKNDIEKVDKFLAAGHPVNVRDNLGWTPLHEAANHGHLEIAKLLIKAGASVNDPGGPECGNITPLHDAATCGHCSIIHLLIEHGADIRLKTDSGESVLKCLENCRTRIEKKRRQGRVEWTSDDENEYQFTRDKLRMILPSDENISSTIRSRNAPLIDDDDDASQPTVVISDEELPVKEKISAGEDYKRTIEYLKNRGRRAGSAKIKPTTSTHQIIAPLVDSEQQLVDDWLEDDMEIFTGSSNTKKRSDDGVTTTAKRKSFRSSTSSSTPENERNTKRPRKSDDSEAFSSLSRQENLNTNFNDSDFYDSQPIKPHLRQTSLLHISGFTNDVTPRTPPSIISYSNDFSSGQKSSVHTEPVQFKVIIEDRIINVKLKLSDDSDTLIRSLTKDVVEKFLQDTGCKPIITFTTTNGEVLQPENILNLLFTNSNDGIQLLGRIVDLEIPAITERYKTLCAALNIDDINDDATVLKSLKACEHTETFRIKGDEEILYITPLLKSLEYERNLKILNLSGSSLFSHGQLVNHTFIQLIQLQELYMQGCDIDQNFLTQINNFPLQLRILDLSYNPLDAVSQSKLSELITPLRHLQHLNLRCCHLKKISSASLMVSTCLDHLDISWNKIEDDDIDCFLQRQLINLNLSYTCHRSIGIIEPRPLAFVTIETLELAGCNINDSDVMNLLQNCQNLSKIVLSDNPNISQVAIEVLLGRKPTLTLINATGCTKVTEGPKSILTIDDPPVCTMMITMASEISHLWEKMWQGHATQYRMPFDLIVFKPIV